MMKLYWKDREVGKNTVICHWGDRGELIRWKVLEIRERSSQVEYYDPERGKEYPLKKVLKSRRLSRKQEEGRLLQVPPGIYYLVVEELGGNPESFNETEVIPGKGNLRCFNVDFLETLRGARIEED